MLKKTHGDKYSWLLITSSNLVLQSTPYYLTDRRIMNHDRRKPHDKMFPFGMALFNLAGIFHGAPGILVPTSTAVGLAADSSNFRWGMWAL